LNVSLEEGVPKTIEWMIDEYGINNPHTNRLVGTSRQPVGV